MRLCVWYHPRSDIGSQSHQDGRPGSQVGCSLLSNNADKKHKTKTNPKIKTTKQDKIELGSQSRQLSGRSLPSFYKNTKKKYKTKQKKNKNKNNQKNKNDIGSQSQQDSRVVRSFALLLAPGKDMDNDKTKS